MDHIGRTCLATATALLVAGVVAHAPALAQDRGGARKLYCYDQNGQRVCSDTLPPEAIDRAREEFNASSGMRSAVVERALTPQERAAQAAAAAQRQLDAASAQTRRRTEQALLSSYPSEDELKRVFAERTVMLDNNIQTARYNLASLRDGLVIQLQKAGDLELGKRKVPAALAADIAGRQRDLLAQQQLLESFLRQRSALDDDIAQALQRYRELKGEAGTQATNPVSAPSVP